MDAEGTRVILCNAGEVAPTRYLESESGRVYEVDHASLEATLVVEEKEETSPESIEEPDKAEGDEEATEGDAEAAPDREEAPTEDEAAEPAEDEDDEAAKEEEPDPLAPARAELAEAIAKYAAGHFGAKDGPHHAVYSRDGALAVVLRGERANLRNFYSGSWVSTWTAKESGSGYAVSGTIRVRAHYFEDGNVQLQTSKTLEDAKAASLADVAALIETTEGALQKGLEAMYDNMTNETFKAMRRIMPISRTKMKWNINEIALNKNLRK